MEPCLICMGFCPCAGFMIYALQPLLLLVVIEAVIECAEFAGLGGLEHYQSTACKRMHRI